MPTWLLARSPDAATQTAHRADAQRLREAEPDVPLSGADWRFTTPRGPTRVGAHERSVGLWRLASLATHLGVKRTRQTMNAYGEVAIAFASALVKGDFVGAHALLAPRARGDLPPEVLRERFFGMFRSYADGEPSSVFYDEQFALDDWPAKQPGDAGWAYVSINGENFVEGVAVTVSTSEGSLLIREVEWGRP